MFCIIFAFFTTNLIGEGLQSFGMDGSFFVIIGSISILAVDLGLGNIFLTLSKKPEIVIYMNENATRRVDLPLDQKPVLKHGKRYVSAKFARILIKLMFIEIVILIFIPLLIEYRIYARYTNRLYIYNYWTFFYVVVFKQKHDVIVLLIITILFFLNPFGTAFAFIKELQLYKKYRNCDLIPLRNAFFVHFYANLVYNFVLLFYSFILFIAGIMLPLDAIYIIPQPIPLTIVMIIIFLLVWLKAKRFS